MMDLTPNNRFDLRELSDTLREPLEGSFNLMEEVPETITSSVLDTQEPCRSGRIIRAPGQFMFLEEVESDELDLDPSSYNEAISDKDLKIQQCTLIMSGNL